MLKISKSKENFPQKNVTKENHIQVCVLLVKPNVGELLSAL